MRDSKREMSLCDGCILLVRELYEMLEDTQIDEMIFLMSIVQLTSVKDGYSTGTTRALSNRAVI